MSATGRIRVQVWIDGKTERMYAAMVAELEDEWATVTLVGDAETRRMRMRSADYLALPYHYFENMGPAPRPAVRRDTEPTC